MWDEDPGSLGLSKDQLERLKTQTAAAREALPAAQSIREAAKAATLVLDDALADMRSTAAECVRTIKAFVGTGASVSGIYARAQIFLPARPAPLPPPGRAESVRVGLEPGGAVRLTWTATGAAKSTGAVFEVLRRIGSAPYEHAGLAQGGPRGRFTFVDAALPAGAGTPGREVGYVLQARRGSVRGPDSAAITVQFGAGRSGAVVADAGLKMAA